MPRVSAAKARCPKPEHVDARVKLDGTYGAPGHRPQRYKCSPREGAPHVFTELLPREEAGHRACEHCEREVERREGPKAPRHYQFVARGIAEALAAVGAGATSMQASRVARARPRRFRIRAEDPSGAGIPGGRVAFDVFCAVGYRAGKPRLWHTEAFASAHPDNWSALFASLPGEPRRAHRGMIQALERR